MDTLTVVMAMLGTDDRLGMQRVSQTPFIDIQRENRHRLLSAFITNG